MDVLPYFNLVGWSCRSTLISACGPFIKPQSSSSPGVPKNKRITIGRSACEAESLVPFPIR